MASSRGRRLLRQAPQMNRMSLLMSASWLSLLLGMWRQWAWYHSLHTSHWSMYPLSGRRQKQYSTCEELFPFPLSSFCCFSTFFLRSCDTYSFSSTSIALILSISWSRLPAALERGVGTTLYSSSLFLLATFLCDVLRGQVSGIRGRRA